MHGLIDHDIMRLIGSYIYVYVSYFTQHYINIFFLCFMKSQIIFLKAKNYSSKFSGLLEDGIDEVFKFCKEYIFHENQSAKLTVRKLLRFCDFLLIKTIEPGAIFHSLNSHSMVELHGVGAAGLPLFRLLLFLFIIFFGYFGMQMSRPDLLRRVATFYFLN